MSRAVVLFLLVPAVAMAHPGGLDEDGGHRCRSNCERHGLEPGEYHYHRLPTFQPPAGTPEPIPQGLPDPARPVAPAPTDPVVTAPPDPDKLPPAPPGTPGPFRPWKTIGYLLLLWGLLRVLQRLEGKPITVRMILRKIFGNALGGGW